MTAECKRIHPSVIESKDRQIEIEKEIQGIEEIKGKLDK